jgi:hypothetical protein
MTTGIRRDQIRGWEIRTGEIGADEIADGSITPTEFASSVYGTGTTTIDPDDATAHGASTALARTDHQHQFTTAAATSITNSNAEGSAATMARSDHNHAYGNGSVSELAIVDTMPRGIVALFSATANSTAFSVSTVSDMVLNNVAVVDNHWYGIHCHTDVSLSGAAQWDINCRVNGTTIARFGHTSGYPVSTFISSTVFWQATATQATDDFDVFCDEITGAVTCTLSATSTRPRWFTITDLGVI